MKKFYSKAQEVKAAFVHDLNIKISKKYLGSLEYNPDRSIEVKEYPTFSDHESDMAVEVSLVWKNLPNSIADKIYDCWGHGHLDLVLDKEIYNLIEKLEVENREVHTGLGDKRIQLDNYTRVDSHSEDGISIDHYKDTFTFHLSVLISIEAENLDDMAESIEDLVDIQVKSLIETFYIIEGRL